MLKTVFFKLKEKIVKSTKIKCIHTTTDCEECMSASYCICKDKNIIHIQKGEE